MKSKNIIIMLFSVSIIFTLLIYHDKTTELAYQANILKNQNKVTLDNKKDSIDTLDNDILIRNNQIQTIKNEIMDLEILYKEKERQLKSANKTLERNTKLFANLEAVNLDKEKKIDSIKQEQKTETTNISRNRIQLDPDTIRNVISIATKNQFSPTSKDITYDSERNIANVFNEKKTYKLLAVGPKVFVLTFSDEDTIYLVQSIDLSKEVVSLEQTVNIVAGE